MSPLPVQTSVSSLEIEASSWPVQVCVSSSLEQACTSSFSSSISSSLEQDSLRPHESRGLAGEFYRRGFSSLPWMDVDTAPPILALVKLGEGTYGKVDLVDFGGEVMVRK